jgi:cytochrome o ubiquinol oxidase subunit 3
MKSNNITFGFWVYLMSDCVLFAGLFATFAVLHGTTFGMPPLGALFSAPYVLGETLLLLTSSFTIGLAVLAAHHHKKNWSLWALLVTLLLGAAFLSMEISEFLHLIAEGNGPDMSAGYSSFFALVGTHGLHVALGSVWMMVVMAHLYLRGIERSYNKLFILSLFWHFLDIIWIFIFTFVYLLNTI